MLKDKWVDKKNGEDINSADDINQVAHAVVDLERKIEDGVLSAEVHVGAGAPVNGELLWVDTDEEDEEENEEAPAAAPPDFAANEGEAGHILNRTHYVDGDGVVHKLDNKFIDADWMATSQENIDNSVVIPKQNVSSGMWSNRQMTIQPGITYDVHINDVVYPCVAFNEDGICLGNNSSLTKNNLPFCIFWAGGSATSGFFYKNSTVLSGSIYMKVTGHSWTDYNKLPEEFLPECVVKTVNGATPDEKGNVNVQGSFYVDISAGDEYTCSTKISTLDALLDTGCSIVAKITTDTGALFAPLCSYETSADNSYGRIVMFALGMVTFTLTPTSSDSYEVTVSGD